MTEVSYSVVIDRPVDEVFAYAGDPVNDPAWTSVIIASEVTSEGPLAKGSTLRQVMRFLGKRIDTRCEVTEYEPGRRLAFTMLADGPNGEHERTFESVDASTRVSLRTRGETAGVFKLADPLVQRIGQRQMATDLANLKDLLEAGASTG